MSKTDLIELASLNGRCSYEDANKASFRRLALRLLKEVAEIMGLNKGTCDIRYNPGGIAVSGDATLHGEKVYVSLNADGFSGGILVRSCKGRKDYVGGTNRWFSLDRLIESGANGLAAFAAEVSQGS